jgi:phosphoglucosamine mutase
MRNQNNIKVMQELENQINNRGRIVLRPSGTEELIRLLIEHENESEIKILLDYFYDNINKT